MTMKFRNGIAEPTRRDLLLISTVATGVAGAFAATVPLISQMNPDASAVASGGPIDIGLGEVEPGSQIVVMWQKKPVFVTFRTNKILASLQDNALVAQLADPDSLNFQQPAYAKNWHRSLTPEIGVYVGVCTHLGCIPQFHPSADSDDLPEDWRGGYFCACHGSKYDLAGRVFSDVPAPFNLPVPPHRFVNDTTIRIGENPKGAHFDFGSILQL